MKIHQIPQNSPEWFNLRKGKLTASKAQAIATAGKGLETLCYELIAGKYSSAEPIDYTNEDMERGRLLEEQARQMYELQTGNRIELIGFIEADEQSGASPDGKIKDQNGGVEIKCPKDSVYLRTLIDQKIDIGYEWQMQMQMLLAGWDFVDYVVYNPNFKKSLLIIRVEADPEKQEKLKIGLEQGKKLLTDLDSKYLKLIS